MKKESVYVDTIKYVDFYGDEESRNILIYEFHDKNYDNYDRAVIMFDDDINKTYIEEEFIPIIWQNKEEILNKGLLKLDDVEEMLSLGNGLDVRLVANTSEYWEDVRLFTYTSGFAYAQGVFDLAAQELAVASYIRDNFYYDDMILKPCRQAKKYEHMYKDIEEALADNKFNHEKVFQVLKDNNFYDNERVKGYFSELILKEQLDDSLPVNNITNKKKVKI